jgi:hypothetical protein
MGWASGSELAQNLWNDIKDFLDEKQKKIVKKAIIKNFEDNDCDTMCEVEWK